jgi:NAD(P)-dependent dehydrogenase (short-subunit alcohol dehydrogenase family)
LELDGGVAVVTGAASGIGLALTRSLAAAGMQVVATDIEPGPLEAAVQDLTVAGYQVTGHRLDVTVGADVRRLAQSTVADFGRVDLLCNNAGVSLSAPIAETTAQDWEWLLAVNLWGPVHGINSFLPLLEQQPGETHINTTSSMAGLYAIASMGAYSASKHAVTALMCSLERDLRRSGSKVHTSILCPYFVRTNIASAGRNRGENFRAATSDGSAAGEKYWHKVRAAVAKGMAPSDVAELVIEGIRSNRFWILTDPSALEFAQAELAAMTADGALRP